MVDDFPSGFLDHRRNVRQLLAGWRNVRSLFVSDQASGMPDGELVAVRAEAG
jgi:hypothetical protein